MESPRELLSDALARVKHQEREGCKPDQASSAQARIKNQESIDGAGVGNPDPDQQLRLGFVLPKALAIRAPARVEDLQRLGQEIFDACPAFGADWGAVYLVELVADGAIGEGLVHYCLRRFKAGVAIAGTAGREPIGDQAAYLAKICMVELHRRKLPWSIRRYRAGRDLKSRRA
jgi:hypothetical protein